MCIVHLVWSVKHDIVFQKAMLLVKVKMELYVIKGKEDRAR